MKGKVLYGVKRAVITPIDADTQQPKEEGKIAFKTAEEVGIEKVVSEGSEEIKRVDDEILAVVSTRDIGYGYNLTLVDNVFNLEVLALIEGGTVRRAEAPLPSSTSEDSQGDFGEVINQPTTRATQEVIGYDDPMMSEEITVPNFKLDLYVANYVGKDIDSYTRLTFPNCTGTVNKMDIKKEFSAPEFTIKAREATKINKPSRSIDIVKTTELPPITE